MYRAVFAPLFNGSLPPATPLFLKLFLLIKGIEFLEGEVQELRILRRKLGAVCYQPAGPRLERAVVTVSPPEASGAK